MSKIRSYENNRIKQIGYDEYFALARSGIRRDILLYLKDYPSGVPIFDIAKSIRASYTNTRGAILGNDGYKINYSLFELRLVTCSKSRGSMVLYQLTPRGREVALLIEEWTRRARKKEEMIWSE
jgi:Uncharacterized protein conserved in archaea